MNSKTRNPQTKADQVCEKSSEDKIVTRRNFIKGTALAGAGAAAILQNESSNAQETKSPDIKIP